MRRSMPKTTYLIELRVDQQWLEAIDKLTGEIYDGEVCDWIRIQPETEEDQDWTQMELSDTIEVTTTEKE